MFICLLLTLSVVYSGFKSFLFNRNSCLTLLGSTEESSQTEPKELSCRPQNQIQELKLTVKVKGTVLTYKDLWKLTVSLWRTKWQIRKTRRWSIKREVGVLSDEHRAQAETSVLCISARVLWENILGFQLQTITAWKLLNIHSDRASANRSDTSCYRD